MIRIVFNKLLNGWYIVRGPHQTPIGGRFETKAEAKAWLERRKSDEAQLDNFNWVGSRHHY